MELLKSPSRHLTVQKDLRLLNSGTLNRGRNLCVTVAIDHSTVDGFHDELQRSANNTQGKALQRISWVKEFYLVRWSDYHSISVFDLLKFHQFGSTVLPESLLQYVWYVGEGEVWKGTLMVADLEQVDKNRRVRIPQRKAQREGYDLAQTGDNSQKPQVDNNNLLEEIRFWELQFWQGTIQVRGEGQEDLLGESDGFPPTTKAGSHCTSTQALHRDQRYPHQNCFKFFLGKLVMNFFNKQTYAVYNG